MRQTVELLVDAKAIKDLTNGYPLILKEAIATTILTNTGETGKT